MLNPTELEIFFSPKDRLRLTVSGTYSVVTVKPAWVAPLSRPKKFLALLNGKGEEIVTIPDPDELDCKSKAAVDEELRRRYLTPTILSILSARSEFGVSYWTAETDRGRREFVTQSLQENAQWMGDGHLLLIDVDGNRFEIPNVSALDERSRLYIDRIV